MRYSIQHSVKEPAEPVHDIRGALAVNGVGIVIQRARSRRHRPNLCFAADAKESFISFGRQMQASAHRASGRRCVRIGFQRSTCRGALATCPIALASHILQAVDFTNRKDMTVCLPKTKCFWASPQPHSHLSSTCGARAARDNWMPAGFLAALICF
jgi:hypothetical protein